MNDHISRDAAILEIQRHGVGCFDPDDFTPEQAERFVISLLNSIPAADVRPVVLCRDCKYWELSKVEPPFRVCTYVCGATFVRASEDFCSRGEKREAS